MDMEQRNKALEQHRRAGYQTDFDPGLTPERPISPEARLAAAAEYAAFQLGQINRKLDRLIEATERLAGSQPDQRPFSQIKREREAKRQS
jgi:hypothetical protein